MFEDGWLPKWSRSYSGACITAMSSHVFQENLLLGDTGTSQPHQEAHEVKHYTTTCPIRKAHHCYSCSWVGYIWPDTNISSTEKVCGYLPQTRPEINQKMQTSPFLAETIPGAE